jgi:hypothetical protein
MSTGEVSMAAFRRGHGDLRESSRIQVMIPVRVGIFSPSTNSAPAAVPGALVNIGRGGGRVRLRWEFPPRTRLLISLPLGKISVRLPAEVVWARHSPDLETEPSVYGIQWGGLLSSAVLELILRRQGLVSEREVTDAPGA